jgi:hypothetical protein
MTRLISLSALAAVLTLAFAADASAWTRYGTVTGPYGTGSVSASGTCYNHTCSRSVVRTGPYGNSVSRQGSATCANGVCTGTRTTTGPYGGTVVRHGSVSR